LFLVIPCRVTSLTEFWFVFLEQQWNAYLFVHDVISSRIYIIRSHHVIVLLE